MSRRYGQAVIETGDLTHPWDLAANLLEIAGEVNGRLDRDNVTAGTLTAADFAVGAFGAIRYDAEASTFSVSNTAGSRDTGWVRLTGSTISWTARDGRAIIEGQASVERGAAGIAAFVTLGVELDGEVVATSDWFDFNETQYISLSVQAERPMSAGSHQVFLVGRVQQLGAVSVRADFSARGLLVEEILA